ncbi:MAG: peptidoglycan-associated lipoprotein Pal [Endomicrobiales bacterium]|nr:peptidoglycan-associated lipoprotein Pal [Endomicrobiales bacterium]
MLKRLTILFCIFILISGCAKQKRSGDMTRGEKAGAEDVDEAGIRHGDWHSTPELKSIHFSFDKSDLLPEAREVLQKNAEYLKSNTDINVMVEGHCDERGTIEYNLGLGQRRASAVREYYGKLGVSLSRIGTISYGEEKPLDTGHTEESWYKNRRAETKIRNIKPPMEAEEGTVNTEKDKDNPGQKKYSP